MRTAKRITTACLTAIMIFQALAPSTEVFAQELDAVMEASVSAARAAGNTARSVQDAVATVLEDADQAPSDGTTATPGVDAGTTEGGNGSTNTGDSQDSTTDGAGGDGAPAEGDVSQDDAPADDAADEEHADDADADAAAQADATYKYNTVEDLKAAGVTNITEENGTVTQIVFANESDLIKISNTNPAVYQNAAIVRSPNTGGEFNLDSAKDGELKFGGFGGGSAPFKGLLNMKGSTLVVSHTLFNNIKLNDDNKAVTVTWKGSDAQPVIASKINGNGQTLVANVAVANVKEGKAKLTSPLMGEVDGVLTLEATYSVDAGKTLAVDINSNTGNIGLLANTVKANASFTINKLEGLPLSGTQTVATTKDGASAGGLIGLCEDGVTVSLANPIDLSNFSVAGAAASGGFIGKATRLTLGADSKKFSCPASVGNANSMNTGGFIGEVSFANSVKFTNNDQIDTSNGVTLLGKGSESNGVGAAIGKLNFIDSTTTVSFNGGTFKSIYGNGGGTAVFGGLVGSVTGCDKSKPLHIENVTTEFALKATPTFAGGLVGWLGRGTGATLEVKNAEVNCTKLLQSSKGFGGVAGCIDNRSIADINGVTVKNEGTIENGAGIAAESWGSAIRLGGVTDFSGMKFAPEKSFTGKKVVSQITNVSSSNPTLVFARGTGRDGVPADADNADYWDYKRCPATKIDDLGSDQNADCGYGEVVRLDGTKLQKDLIKINMDEHKLEGPSRTDWSWQVGYGQSWTDGNRELVIANEKDFACLALSLQFGALWNGVYGLNPGNRGQLLGSDVTISLSGNINLSGTGIGGLGFDSASNLQIFQGTFNGNGHTIILGIGEPYGMRGDNAIAPNDASAGNGKIYRHSRLGLFAAIGGATANNQIATVNKLTVDGSIKFDNGLGVDAGSLAATITGNATLNGVTCSAAITCDDSFGNDVNIGGIAGSMSGAGTVTFGGGNTSGRTKAQATVKTGDTLNGNTRIGGAVGYVADIVATANVASLEIGGKITAGDSASDKKAQVGGFIGCITQGTAANTTNVNITGLSFDSFTMTVGKNGDAKNGAGGLLGYSWGNTVVTIGDSTKNTSDSTYALKTNNASITANNSGELGGLVYAASGHWVINDYAIDLSGATINAVQATMLGLLVGRGSKVASGAYGSEPYTGLYLEDRAYWETAYKVPSDEDAVVAPSVTIFDEWVGNGRKPGSKLMDGEWNAVVSLHTKDDVNDGKLDMGGEPGNDNSYHNRSDFGNDHNTNAWTRYYYNLDRAYNALSTNGKDYTAQKPVQLTAPEELLLWSACRYAPADIQKYVAPGMTGVNAGLNSNTVYINGGTSSKQKTIDLSGYSYYPAQPKGQVIVQNVNVRFCYANIKSEFANNKSNSAGTQHENMHCGLLRTINANLTVSNVTLGGTIGIAVNDGDTSKAGPGGTASGALVCRYIYGGSNSVKQISINNLTLDGLTVDDVNDKTSYAPLLINEMQTYVNLNATNISTKGYEKGTKAATSLFGRLGVGSAADQVTATFSAISLPSAADSSIFTRASLLESFGYGEGKTGSAVYTFMKDDQTNEKVTFGSEIDSKGEYSGKQLWYYNESTYGTRAGLVTVDNKEANADTPQFGGYLPYVKKGNVNENKVQYHEIKVNQRVPKLTTGCGTYGDPYAITKASELNTVAEYINTQNAIDGWEVTIAANQEELCQRRSPSEDTGNEVTYVYKQAKKTWEKKTREGTTDPNDTLDDATMHSYLQSAYYSIEPVDSKGTRADTLVLDTAAFQGLGNQDNPFRGVIVGNLRSGGLATIKINKPEGATALSGLIPYSYGSVVSNLNIEYSGTAASIAYKNKDTSGVPGAFFGGVIGCIMGGDNIIDGVSVNASGGFSVAGATGDNGGAHLVPVGGYVGAVAGGGVIFRNSSSGDGALNAWHSAGTSLYDNPYVGRVIDGYAFSELAAGKSLDNTDRNYKVNNLDVSDTNCIVTGETQGRYRGDGTNNNLAITTTVNDSQGLLVLSAIISSGAAGGSANTTAPDQVHASSYGTYAGSRAYLGGNVPPNKKGYKFGNQNYGKVRNASYAYVGKPLSAAEDFANAISDDMKSPGIQSEDNALEYAGDGSGVNSPYLVKKYATWQTGYICTAQVSGMDLQFVNTDKDIDYDMTPYGTGYTGLSGRYYSNACASANGADRDRIVPLVACINGNGATIKVGSNGSDGSDKNPYDITEYTDDNYKLTGVGALFGTVTYTSTNVSESIGTPAADGTDATGNGGYAVQNLKFDDCNISFRYVTYSPAATGENKNLPSLTTPDFAGQIGVGLLAGTTANANSLEGYGKYGTVEMTKCGVNGPTNVGGLIGASGYGARSTDKSDITWMVNRTGGQPSPVKLYDCSYDGMTVNGGQNTGGFVGKLNEGSQGGVWTTSDKDIARDSTIESMSTDPRAGGVIGVSGGAVYVNADPTTTDSIAGGKATIKNVSVKVPSNAGKTSGVGGFIGEAKGNVCAYKLVVTSDTTIKPVLGAANADPLKNVGGIVGYVTGGNEFKFDSCEVSNIDIESREVSGGISGSISNSPSVVCNNVVISGNTFSSSYAGGINGSLGGAPTFSITNTVIMNNVFINRRNAWESSQGSNNKSRSGGLGGDGRGVFNLANVLFDSNDFQGKNGQGVFFGDAKSGLKIYAAGIDIKPGNEKARDDLPPLLFDTSADQSTVKQINMVSYVAFGDYKDALAAPDKNVTLYSDDDASGNETVAASPYVTTSPTSKIAVRVSEFDTTDRYLFGDGANVGLVETIKSEAKAGKSESGSYAYTNIGGSNDSGEYQNDASGFDERSCIGSFNGNNESKKVDKDKNFDVLVLSGGDTTTVESYLNIVTNGGYSDAKRLNSTAAKHVTANLETFVLDENGHFVRDKDSIPTVSIENQGSSKMKFRTSGSTWDNEKGRFTLLTVTFTEAGQSYKVQVPIIVKRMLEVDFTATFVEGSNFKSSNYTGRGANAHVLIGSGETMTGYLTWTYGQAYGKTTNYGWNTYLASGGSMRPLQKKIKFLGDGAKGTMPAGTQLTLVDTANNNKEYHYTVGAGGTDSVSLSDFADAGNKKYIEPWLSEEVGVTASQDNINGSWVETTVDDATAKIGDKYYRPKTAADVNAKKTLYKLSVPNESPVTENFYLVVRTPSNSASVNGYTATEIGNTSVNTRINYTLRTGDNGLDEDDHHNTASTYSVASNYTHSLEDQESGTKQMTMIDTTYPLNMKVRDTIKFGDQEYTDSDTVYYQLDSSLVNYEKGNAAGAHGYPTGTQGTYSFYVQVGNTYYKWNRANGWKPADAEEPAVEAKSWSSKTGSDMSLVLADGSGAIDLSGIREAAKSHGYHEFTITMKANLTMTEPACQAGIVASQDSGKDKYTKPNYRAYLSTHADTLSTSSNSAYTDGRAGYYRMDVGSSTIALEASKKSQLGINIDDLKSADGEIALVGTYDLSKLAGAEAMISNADTVTYTLSLQQRQDTGKYAEVSDISKYITVLGSDKLGAGSLSGNSYVFTDNKTGGKFATLDDNSLAFAHAFRVKVNTDVEGKSQTEGKSQKTYANYRLVLTANMTGGGVNDTPVNVSNLADYAHSDCVTYTLARINTEGIQHGSGTN
ncbi:hypothetical protein [Collinsella sp. AF20-14LB]|uniref:hypothetical protein n=1 Tax=Collinsella sp. AF20-14LB TaxID=2292221 RepID=UPI000E55344E|nr:hypothetical protein [Collinsella sp. AF20-14LB]RGS92831.1 hypothetical protein DWX63_04990 [Collinsella sp. AF20-14LB]